MLRNRAKLFSFSLEISISFTLVSVLIFCNTNTSFTQTLGSSNCIFYDPSDMVITVKCKSASLRDIDNQLNDPNILHMESADGVWKLNAGVVVEEGATLYINSSDLSWLKILTKEDNEGEGEEEVNTNIIEVFGSLKIDSIKLTSWDESTNDYARNPGSRDLSENQVEIGTPRPYISVESDATGTTDITNSEIAYLGYEGGVGAGPDNGITYFGGEGSIIRNNDIHDLYFGFYSNAVGNITIENNAIHHNVHYGLDPHTGTHDMIIRNNRVHDNGGIGIICSLDCYNIMIENNTVYNNTKMGIMFSRNMYDSVARNNIVSHEEKGIVISESHNNQIYNNDVSDSGRGIDLDKESYGNVIYNNAIRNIPDPSDALHIEDGAAEDNTLHSNKVITPKEVVQSANDLLDEGQSTDFPSKTNESNNPFSLRFK
jgi:mannuronan 5-epimerase